MTAVLTPPAVTEPSCHRVFVPRHRFEEPALHEPNELGAEHALWDEVQGVRLLVEAGLEDTFLEVEAQLRRDRPIC